MEQIIDSINFNKNHTAIYLGKGYLNPNGFSLCVLVP
jgi:hypothetical protein